MVADSLTFFGAARIALWIIFLSWAAVGLDVDVIPCVAVSAAQALGANTIARIAVIAHPETLIIDIISSFWYPVSHETRCVKPQANQS